MNIQGFTDAFILYLSGAAEMKNEKEMWHTNDFNEKITIEFPSNTPSHVIIRRYRDNGNIWWEQIDHPDNSGFLNGTVSKWNYDGKLVTDKVKFRCGKRQ